MIENHILDKSVPIPLYYQLKTIISTEIDDGNYPPNAPIPTEDELGREFNVSRTTVRQAITELVQEGRLYRIKSKGTFVAEKKLEQDFSNRIQSFDERILQMGQTPSTQVLDFRKGAAPADVAARLHIPEKSPIIFLQRLRCANGEPVLLEKLYFASPACDFLLAHDMAQDSLTAVMKERGPAFQFHHLKRSAEAIKTPKAISSLMGIKTGDPMLYCDSIGYNEAGQPISYGREFYHGSHVKFEMTVMA